MDSFSMNLQCEDVYNDIWQDDKDDYYDDDDTNLWVPADGNYPQFSDRGF